MRHDHRRDLLGMEPDDLHAPGLCSFGGGGGTTSTNTVTKSDPWIGQQPGLMEMYNVAQNQFNDQPAPQYFPGDTYAGLSGGQKSLIGNLINYGGGGGGPALQSAQATLANTMSPGYLGQTQGTFNQGQGLLSSQLDPSYLNPWNSGSFQTVVNNTLANTIPAASRSFVNGNRSDSGLAQRATTMAATDAVGQLAQNQYQANQAIQQSSLQQAANNYLTQQGNQLKSAALAPAVDQTVLGNLSNAVSTSGSLQQDLQNQINSEMSRYNYGQMLPWNNLGLFSNALQGGGSVGGSSNATSTQPYYSNPLANVASGIGAAGTALTLASLGAQAAEYSGLVSGGSSALGALAGFLGLSASDRRVKEDIHKIGESDSGFPLYTFRYKGESGLAKHIGVMAQDVEKKRPGAVHTLPSGIKMVDYGKALAT